MGVGHYENFPVASVLLPARLRHPISVIYRFARRADDYADEGELEPAERLRRLRACADQLDCIERRQPPAEPLFAELAAVREQFDLPLQPLRELLSAFEQDVVKSRYQDFTELLDYCRRSANPVGRLLLHLFDQADAENLVCSDRICTALQLINFWQDVQVDYAKNRIYLPAEEMARFGVTEAHLAEGRADDAFRALMRFQIARTRRLLHEGAHLGRRMRGRIGLELRMTVAGGDSILQKLLDNDCDVFRRRPVLRARDWAAMLLRALRGDGTIASPRFERRHDTA